MRKFLTIFVIVYTFYLSPANACTCGNWTYLTFFQTVSSHTLNYIIVVDSIKGKYGNSGSTYLPYAYATGRILDTIGNMPEGPGDTIGIFGQDGLNCGVYMTFWNVGDTFAITVYDNAQSWIYNIPSGLKYLDGCNQHALKIKQNDDATWTYNLAKESFRLAYVSNSPFKLENELVVKQRNRLFEIQSNSTNYLELKVLNLQGSVLKNVIIEPNSTNEFSFKELPSGMILIHIDSKGIIRTEKYILN